MNLDALFDCNRNTRISIDEHHKNLKIQHVSHYLKSANKKMLSTYGWEFEVIKNHIQYLKDMLHDLTQ